MRTIDADALSKKLLEELHNRLMQGFGKGLMLANSCVINAPTIEPERKKGKWIEQDDCWDDAFDVDAEDAERIIYTDRFPKPDWCKEEGE